jgi:hypothetical protein
MVNVEDRKGRESLKPYLGYLYPKATLNPVSFGLCVWKGIDI